MAEVLIFSTDFSSEESYSGLSWLNAPQNKEQLVKDVDGGSGILVSMDEKKDFWQKTYYNPPIDKDDGHVLYKDVSDLTMVAETSFTLRPINQFDQAGLIVRFDTDHWIKTGLEYVDGSCLLSCVVTNKYSDWSTQKWPSMKLHIRIFRQGNDFVVESSPDGSTWGMMRICHLDIQPDATLKIGVTACAPTAVGGEVTFHKLSMQKNQGYHHKA